MIILTANNYKTLDKIPHVDNPIETPDIVFYPEIFNHAASNKMLETVKTLKLVNGQTWLVDDPSLRVDKRISVQPFPLFIEHIRDDIVKVTKQTFNACLVTKQYNKLPKLSHELLGYDFIIPTIYIGDTQQLVLKSTNNMEMDDKNIINLVTGSLIIQRETVQKYWDIGLNPSTDDSPFYMLTFAHIYKPEHINPCLVNTKQKTNTVKLPYDLSKIYLSSKMRLYFTRKIKNGLSMIHSIPEGSQCFMKNGINDLKKYIKLGDLIGTGDWGNVYSACLATDIMCKRKFAIKMARITQEDFDDPYTETSSAWYEIWMLKDIIKPLVERNVCPNLPLFIDTFLCDKCDFVFRKGDKQHPCVITAMELASGDMKNYLKFGRLSDDEIYSALFQVMAGLHAIQMTGQILNNDIKSKNILVYDVKPGGYWHYKIGKHNFYVPNYGKMFVLNDFGVSTLYDPNFQLYPSKNRRTFNLGSRFAINMDGVFSPIETRTEYVNKKLRKTNVVKWLKTKDGSLQQKSYGGTYKIDRKTGQVITSHTTLTPLQKSYLFRKGITTNSKTWGFFEHPNIIPPFEFYNDVQDALRTFVGGKRTTQSGNHPTYSTVSKNVRESILPYMGAAENAKQREFSFYTYHVLAGEFITKFFTETYSYLKRPKGKKISYYDMNKCIQSKQS